MAPPAWVRTRFFRLFRAFPVVGLMPMARRAASETQRPPALNRRPTAPFFEVLQRVGAMSVVVCCSVDLSQFFYSAAQHGRKTYPRTGGRPSQVRIHQQAAARHLLQDRPSLSRRSSSGATAWLRCSFPEGLRAASHGAAVHRRPDGAGVSTIRGTTTSRLKGSKTRDPPIHPASEGSGKTSRRKSSRARRITQRACDIVATHTTFSTNSSGCFWYKHSSITRNGYAASCGPASGRLSRTAFWWCYHPATTGCWPPCRCIRPAGSSGRTVCDTRCRTRSNTKG